MVPNFFTFREVVELKVHELAVGDADEGAVERAHLGRAKPDLFDGPDFIAKPAELPDTHGPRRVQREGSDKILNRLLCGQSHRDTADAQACKDRRHVEADVIQPHECDDEDSGDLEGMGCRG